MAYKRGQTETPSFTLGLIISLLILLALGIIGYQIAQKNVDVRARVAFTDFLHYYANCTSYGATDCYCETFDLSLMPGEYSIRVVDLESDQLGFELIKGNDVRQKTYTPGQQLCAYRYSSEGMFYAEPLSSHIFTHRKGESLRTALIPLHNNTCFAISSTPFASAVTAVLEPLHRKKTSCAATQYSSLPLTFIYHEALNSDPRMFSLLDTLDQHLISFSRVSLYHDYGASSYYTNERLFRAAPNHNFSSMTILSFDYSRSDFLYSLGKTTLDHVIIRYLSNSPQSLLLAQAFSDALQPLPITLTSVDDDDAPSIMFWADDDSPLYSQRQSIPAISLEFVDDGQEPYFLDYKERTLAQAMSSAVLTSLSTITVLETEPLFQE